jgi:hypothetical protein
LQIGENNQTDAGAGVLTRAGGQGKAGQDRGDDPAKDLLKAGHSNGKMDGTD